MAKKPLQKPAIPVNVNFLSERDQGISEIPIFVTRAKEKPQKKSNTKTKKESDGS